MKKFIFITLLIFCVLIVLFPLILYFIFDIRTKYDRRPKPQFESHIEQVSPLFDYDQIQIKASTGDEDTPFPWLSIRVPGNNKLIIRDSDTNPFIELTPLAGEIVYSQVNSEYTLQSITSEQNRIHPGAGVFLQNIITQGYQLSLPNMEIHFLNHGTSVLSYPQDFQTLAHYVGYTGTNWELIPDTSTILKTEEVSKKYMYIVKLDESIRGISYADLANWKSRWLLQEDYAQLSTTIEYNNQVHTVQIGNINHPSRILFYRMGYVYSPCHYETVVMQNSSGNPSLMPCSEYAF